MLQAGERIERYQVLSVLGQGGMAVVYRVRHSRLGSDHALKLLTVHGPTIRQRLLQEGQAQARLRHPNVVAVSDVLELDGAPALVMEYVGGPDLGSWLTQHQPTLREALDIFDGIVAGVRRAHQEGLVHRDLKPGNVLMAPDGDGGWTPKVADFGLVKALESEGTSHTRSGVGMGTPAYMAPEQFRSAKGVDHRADLFSLGCILYSLVCGRPPYGGDDLFQLMTDINGGRYDAPDRIVPDLPGRVGAAIRGCLEPDRDRRIADCDTLRGVLRGDLAWPPASTAQRLGGGDTLDFSSFEALDTGAPPTLQADTAAGIALRSAETIDPEAIAGDSTPPRPRDSRAAPAPAAPSRPPAPRPPAASPGRGPVVLVLATVGAVAVAAGAYVMGTGGSAPAERAPAGPAAVAEAPPAAPAPVVAEPGPSGAPAPAPARPTPADVGPASAPEPDAAPTPAAPPEAARSPAPAAVAPDPAPEAARPEPDAPPPEAPVEASPPAAPTTATVTVENGGLVRLSKGGVKFRPGEVEPGTYTVLATFGGTTPQSAGSLTVEAGQAVTVACNDLLKTCSW